MEPAQLGRRHPASARLFPENRFLLLAAGLDPLDAAPLPLRSVNAALLGGHITSGYIEYTDHRGDPVGD